MSDTPNRNIPLVPQGTLDPAAGLNDALQVIDALLQTAVISMDQTSPPASSADGDLYIVAPAGATGAWAGQENNLARYVFEGNFWQFYVAGDQVALVLNSEDGGFYKFIPGSPGNWTLAAGLSDAPNDGARYARQSGTWVDNGLTILGGDTSPAIIVTPAEVLIFNGAEVENPSPGVVEITIPAFDASTTIITSADESAQFPSSRQLVAAGQVQFDDATANQRRIVVYAPNKEWRNIDAAIAAPIGATALVAVGTGSTPAKATGGTMNGYVGKRRSTSTTAANNVASFRSGNAQDEAYAATTGPARSAGLFCRLRFGTAAVVAGERFFAGMALNAAEAGTVDPSALLNCFGVGKDGADTNWQLFNNDGSGAATKTDLGLAFAANQFFQLDLFVPIGGGSWTYRLTDLDTGTVYTGTVSTNIPAANTALNWRIWGSVGTTAGTAISVDMEYAGIRYPL